MTRTMTLALLSLPAAAGCGESLLGGDSLEALLGVVEQPEAPGWELRWVSEGDLLYAACSLQAVDWIGVEEIFYGQIEASGPSLDAPPFWNQGDEYRWALALLVLADDEAYEPLQGFEAALAFDERGLWGGAENVALFFADGDTTAVQRELLVGESDAFEADGEPAWVGWVPEVVALSGGFWSSLYSLADTDLEEIGEAIPVSAYEYLDDDAWAVLSGEILGGAAPLCEESF